MDYLFLYSLGKGVLWSKTLLSAILISILILGFDLSAMTQHLDLSDLHCIDNSELLQIDIQSLMDENSNEIL